MKVISSLDMSELENKAYLQGCTDHDFMEMAGKGIARATVDYLESHAFPHVVWLLCGKGNNGGDAFVAGRYLLDKGYRVSAIQPDDFEKCSPLCQQNRILFLNQGGELFRQVESFGKEGVILDGIFGTGFKGKVAEPYASLISSANRSMLSILAIDIPSGLNGSTGKWEGCVVNAVETIFLGLPKTGFFLNKGWEVAGKLRSVDFGLPAELIEQAPSKMELVTEEWAKSLIPPIKRTRHKYQAGYVIGLAGSPSMPGAAILSSLSALRGGSGIVRLYYPKGMEAELSSSPYELIKHPFENGKLEEMISSMQKAGAVFAGPGLGREEETLDLLHHLFTKPSLLTKPCVLDADALALYAKKPFELPPYTVLTPHRGEMQMLLGLEKPLELNEETLHVCQQYAEEKHVTLILKGAPTFIFHPGEQVCVNPTGDPGMATAGSGDVLTGLIASLLSQGLTCRNGAILGVYLHGLAGELAVKARGTSYGLIASDIIDHIGAAYVKGT